jgi:hypothetical protein
MMESGQTLYLAGGAVVHTIVNGNFVKDVKVMGRGIIDGSQYEGVVAYSMGNFISNQDPDPKYKDAGMIFNVTMEKDNATGTVRIKDATYLPTCTYKITGKTYKVIPVGKFIDNSDLMKIIAGSKQARVKSVWKATTDLIGSDAAKPVRD